MIRCRSTTRSTSSSPSQSVSVLVVDDGAPNSSFYLSKALAIGTTPAFNVEVVPASRVTPLISNAGRRSSLNDTGLASGLAGGALEQFVKNGGGLPDRRRRNTNCRQTKRHFSPDNSGLWWTAWMAAAHRLASARLQPSGVRSLQGAPGGDFSAARVLRYRACKRCQTLACSRDTTTAAWRSQNDASAPGVCAAAHDRPGRFVERPPS